jgi:hypothetical protein
MSTTASPLSPYVVPHTVTTGSNPRLEAIQAGAARTADQHALVMVSKGKVGGGSGGKKNKKSKKYSRKSAMKNRFSKKFRRSILRRKSRKMSLHKKNKKALALRGGATETTTTTVGKPTITIPSFSQTSVGGTNIINQLAGNHAQTLAYSTYDGDVSKPPVS